jgi:hypothetical protein
MFEVGDEVYSLNNSVWGTRPMKIVKLSGISDNSILVLLHPTCGEGGFTFQNLIKAEEVSEERKKNLHIYEVMRKLGAQATLPALDLEYKLFGKRGNPYDSSG